MCLDLWEECIKRQDVGSPVGIDTIPVEDGGAYMLVRRVGTVASEKEMAEIRMLKVGLFSGDDQMTLIEIMSEWLAEYGVTGWCGIRLPSETEDLEFTRENCRRIFKSQAYVGLVNKLFTEAQNREAFLNERLKEIENNLAKK